LARTSLTRVGIGALDPTHGHAVDAACALPAPTAAVSDAAPATSVSPAISDLLTWDFLVFLGCRLSIGGLSSADLARRDLLSIGRFSMLAPEAESFALKLK
jgi:hypothetical protein